MTQHLRKLKNLNILIECRSNYQLSVAQLVKLCTTMECLTIHFDRIYWKSRKFINKSVLVTINSIYVKKIRILLDILESMKGGESRFVIDINDSILNYGATYYNNRSFRGYDVYLSVRNIRVAHILLYSEPPIIYDYVDVLKSTTGYLMANRTIYLTYTPFKRRSY